MNRFVRLIPPREATLVTAMWIFLGFVHPNALASADNPGLIPMNLQPVTSPYTRCQGLVQNQPPEPGVPVQTITACWTNPEVVPPTGLLINSFHFLYDQQQAEQFALAVASQYENDAQANETHWKHIQSCLKAMPNWQSPTPPDCAQDIDSMRSQVLPAVRQVRLLEALAYAPRAHPMNAAAPTEDDLIDYNLDPIPGWILPDSKEPLSAKAIGNQPSERDQANASLEAALGAIKTAFEKQLEKQLPAGSTSDAVISAQPNAFDNNRELAARLRTLHGVSIKDSLHDTWPQWAQFRDKALGGFRLAELGVLRKVLSQHNELAFVRSPNPTPGDMSDAIGQILLRNEEGMKRESDLADKIKSGKSFDVKPLYDLISFPEVADQVLQQYPAFCRIATALAFDQQNSETRKQLYWGIPISVASLVAGPIAGSAAIPFATTIARAIGIASAGAFGAQSLASIRQEQEQFQKALDVAFTTAPGNAPVGTVGEASDAAFDVQDTWEVLVPLNLMGSPVLANARGAMSLVKNVVAK